MTKTRTAAWAVLLALAAWPGAARAGDEPEQRALDRAHNFLKTERRGRDVLSYVHFGATYRGHAFKEWRHVNDGGRRVPGEFALVYVYRWDDDGQTEVIFLCDARGNVSEVQTGRTNAIVQQPFVLANGAIKLLGALLLEALKDQLTPADRRTLQQLVDDANARGMLEWSLKVQQGLGG